MQISASVLVDECTEGIKKVQKCGPLHWAKVKVELVIAFIIYSLYLLALGRFHMYEKVRTTLSF